jgi:hypothetical protein
MTYNNIIGSKWDCSESFATREGMMLSVDGSGQKNLLTYTPSLLHIFKVTKIFLGEWDGSILDEFSL